MISCCRPVVRTLRVARTQLRRACNNPTSIRLFTSSAIPEKPEKVGYVEFANSVIARHPIECLASVVLLEYVAFNGSLHVIRMLDLQFGPELAIAFAATRGLKPVLLPVKIGAAALAAQAIPVLGRFELTGVTTALSHWRQTISQRVATMLGKSSQSDLHVTPSKQPSPFSKPLSTVRKVIDKYGVAYMIGSRYVGVAAMAGLYVALTSGLDVSAMIEAQGWKSAGDVAGDWAAAFVLSGLVFPAGLYCVPFVATALSRWKSVLPKH